MSSERLEGTEWRKGAEWPRARGGRRARVRRAGAARTEIVQPRLRVRRAAHADVDAYGLAVAAVGAHATEGGGDETPKAGGHPVLETEEENEDSN